MNRSTLAAAILEAERFITRAKALPDPQPYEHNGHAYNHDYFPREQGAIKRASMDLTRALADLRRPA